MIINLDSKQWKFSKFFESLNSSPLLLKANYLVFTFYKLFIQQILIFDQLVKI